MNKNIIIIPAILLSIVSSSDAMDPAQFAMHTHLQHVRNSQVRLENETQAQQAYHHNRESQRTFESQHGWGSQRSYAPSLPNTPNWRDFILHSNDLMGSHHTISGKHQLNINQLKSLDDNQLLTLKNSIILEFLYDCSPNSQRVDVMNVAITLLKEHNPNLLKGCPITENWPQMKMIQGFGSDKGRRDTTHDHLLYIKNDGSYALQSVFSSPYYEPKFDSNARPFKRNS